MFCFLLEICRIQLFYTLKNPMLNKCLYSMVKYQNVINYYLTFIDSLKVPSIFSCISFDVAFVKKNTNDHYEWSQPDDTFKVFLFNEHVH